MWYNLDADGGRTPIADKEQMVTNTTYEMDAQAITIPALTIDRPEREAAHVQIVERYEERDGIHGHVVGAAIVETRDRRIFVWVVDMNEDTEGDTRPPWALLFEGQRFVPWFFMDRYDAAGVWAPHGGEFTGGDAEQVHALAAWLIEREEAFRRYGLA